MMMFRGPQTRLDLNIASGPDHEGWCRVNITLDSPAGRWSASAPCLSGQEVKRLAERLGATAEDAAVERLEFLNSSPAERQWSGSLLLVIE